MAVQIWSQRIVREYENSIVSVIVDSFPGFYPEGQGEVLLFTNSCDERTGLSDNLLDKCKSGELDFTDIGNEVQGNFRDVPFGFITTKEDPIQKLFFCLGMKELSGNVLAGIVSARECVDDEEFYNGLVGHIQTYTVPEENNVITYVLDGEQHCFIDRPDIFNATAPGQISLLEWLQTITNPTETIVSICTNATQDTNFPCDPTLTDAQFVPGENQRDDQKQENQDSNENHGNKLMASFILQLILLFHVM